MDPLAELVVVDKERTRVEEFLIRGRRWVGTVVKKQVLGLVCGLVFFNFFDNMYILSTIALEIGTFFETPSRFRKVVF